MQYTQKETLYGEASDDAYCIAMYRRAAMQDDPRARAWMEQRFRATVLGWLQRHPAVEAVCAFHPEEYYVGATFEHLYRMAKQFSLQTCKLHTLLRYMQVCLSAVIGDVLREAKASSRRAGNTSGDWQAEGEALWQQLQLLLPAPREQRLAYLLYVCGLKPGEIRQRFPREFSDLEEIIRLNCLMLERLQQITRMDSFRIAK